MDKIKYYFIVTASGIGKRMGFSYPKQFHEIFGKPIFIITLEEIMKSKLIDKIFITTNKENINKVKSYINEYIIKTDNKENNKIEIIILEGGSERQYSVYNALMYMKNELNYSENKDIIVGVQDAVRPNIKVRYIDDIYNAIVEDSEVDGFVVGVPSKDTIKIIDDKGYIVDTPKREKVFNAHTPQIFRLSTIIKAYECAKKDNFLGTDDSSLIERLGGKVKVYIGEYDNIKITTIDDLRFFE